MHDQDARARARRIAEAQGIAAAARLTGIGTSTLYRWAAEDAWALRRDKALHRDSGSRGAVRDPEKGQASHSPVPASPQAMLDRAHDLAAQVYEQTAAAVLDGSGRPAAFRDAAVALAIAMDKRQQYGRRDDQGGSHEERLDRVVRYLRDLWPKLEARRRAQLALEAAERQAGNGQPGGVG
jgi:hypothetical protein